MAVRGIDKFDFYQHFLSMNISLHNQDKLLKFSLWVLYYHIEETVSQILDLGPIFYSMKSRK